MAADFVSCRELVEELREAHGLTEGHETSNIEKRCVYNLVKKDDNDSSPREKLSRAFAICRSSLQRSGRYKKGTADLTKMGARRSSAKAHHKDNKKKVGGFGKMVAAARKKD